MSKNNKLYNLLYLPTGTIVENCKYNSYQQLIPDSWKIVKKSRADIRYFLKKILEHKFTIEFYMHNDMWDMYFSNNLRQHHFEFKRTNNFGE